MTNAPTLKIHNQFLKKALSLLCLLSLFSCASLNLSESRYNLQGKILFTENGEKKDFRKKIIKENESLQVLFLDILGFTQLGEMNALGNEWVYKNNLIDVSIDLTPNDLRYLLEKNRCSKRCNIDATFGNVRVLLKNV